MRANKQPQPPEKSRSGMILLTTLVLVLILTVAGGVLLFKNRSELATTTNYRNHQKALANADTVMKVTMKALDVMVATSNYNEVERFFEHSGTTYKYKFTFSDNFKNFPSNVADKKRTSIKSRYLGAGGVSGGNQPDLVVSDLNDRVIGLARISFDFIDRTIAYGGKATPGGSMEMKGMGSGSDTLSSFYVITVVGRDPETVEGDIFTDDPTVSAGPQAFLTALYCVGSICEKT
ncbi:MAG: hypothetical protein LBR11_01200 [Deltaproteobacteria bacterium]|jgi:uncharacterized protein YxeA|nr:hypothetical protein [Deltaproteobacteria bacterium]